MKTNICTKGILIEECKNRFICKVLINEETEECYLPLSSKLKNYMDVNYNEVSLTYNQSKNSRTRMSVFAIKNKEDYILINSKIINSLVREKIINEFKINEDKFFEEKKIEDYKCDLFIEGNEEIIIEIKTFIPDKDINVFPKVHSTRAIRQLSQIISLLDKGLNIHYYIIGLSNNVKSVSINKNEEEYFKLLKKAIRKGLKLRGFNIQISEEDVKIDEDIIIEI